MKSLSAALNEIKEELLESNIILNHHESNHGSVSNKPTLNITQEIKQSSREEFFKFQLYVKGEDAVEHSVGMAYLKKGLSFYTLKLWTFLDLKFYLLPKKDDPSRYLVMSREENKTSNPKNKYFWNIIGNAKANPKQCVLEIDFDLFPRNIFMNLYPEDNTSSKERNRPASAKDAFLNIDQMRILRTDNYYKGILNEYKLVSKTDFNCSHCSFCARSISCGP